MSVNNQGALIQVQSTSGMLQSLKVMYVHVLRAEVVFRCINKDRRIEGIAYISV